MKANKKQAIEMMAKMADKYCSLVWYARTDQNASSEQWQDTPNDIFLKAFEQIKIVEHKYPEETFKLSGIDGDFHHGFNSGVLAGLRYALELLDGDIDYANENFPELDT